MRLDYSRALFIAVSLTMLGCYCLMYYWTPFQIDDFIFAHYYREANSGSESFSLAALADMTKEVRAEENGRLANLIAGPWVLWVPKFIAAALMSITTVSMIYLIGVLSKDGTKLSAGELIFAWAFCAVLLPWRESIFVADLFLNYVAASISLLAFIYLFVKAGDESSRMMHMAAPMFIAFMASWFHETAGLVGGVGIAAYACSLKFRLSHTQWLMTAAFAVGLGISISSPAIWARLDNAEAGQNLINGLSVRGFIKALPASTALLITISVSAMFKSGRRMLYGLFSRKISIITIAAVAAGAAIVIRLGAGNSRAGWFSELFAIIALATLLRQIKAAYAPRLIFALCAFGLMIAFFINVLKWQHYYFSEDKDIWQEIETSETGTVFHDWNETCPLSTLLYPSNKIWTSPIHLCAVNVEGNQRIVTCVPKALSSLSTEKFLTPIDGNAAIYDFNGVLIQHNYKFEAPSFVWGKASERETERPVVDDFYTYHTSDGQVWSDVPSMKLKFVSVSGDTMVNVRPLNWRVKGPYTRIDKSRR